MRRHQFVKAPKILNWKALSGRAPSAMPALSLCILGALVAMGLVAGHAAAAELRNDAIAVRVSPSGAIEEIQNRGSGEAYRVASDSITIETDRGTFTTAAAEVLGPQTADTLRYAFSANGQFRVILEYKLVAGHPYIRRTVTLAHASQPVTILKIELARTAFEQSPAESVDYDTFWNAPTVSFLRWAKGGVFTGIENPFFETQRRGAEFAFSFEPAMTLKPGETYRSEPQFIGVYTKSGRMIREQLPLNRLTEGDVRRPRMRNPSGNIPLDTNEIAAMRDFAAEYLAVPVEKFLYILYCFWNPMAQIVTTEEEEKGYTKMLDSFGELGGDMIIFNPMAKAQIPTADPTSYWTLAPEGTGPARILDYAAKKGMKYGFYIGCAAQLEHGNAAGNPFVPERKDWKRIDAAGNVATENCIASDEYADWWYTVQRNTIAKYKLSLWAWDPGPGHGFFCYSARHGHLPGKGGYKGWRNSTEVMRKLKESFPGLYYQGFYGRKEYGLWGQKYTDQHEFYWEQYFQDVRSLHPDLHADRLNADGVRMQSWWSENFRFLPTVMNHAVSHRMNQLYAHPPGLKKLWDHIGWKYAFMSALSVGGSLTAPFMPENMDDIPGYREFVKKWLGWARENFEYVKNGVSFGDQVTVGGIDGHARIKGDHGFIFLANPNPRPTRTTFRLDGEIGLAARGKFTLKELYPSDGAFYYDAANKRGVYNTGEAVSIVLPAFEVTLLELSPFKDEQLPLVFGTAGQTRRAGNALRITGASGDAGAATQITVLAKSGDTLKTVNVNGRSIGARREGDLLAGDIQFAGRPLARILDDWRTADGKPFSFPYHDAAESVSLRTSFVADPQIQILLKNALGPNAAEVATLAGKLGDSGWEIPGIIKEDKFPDTFPWARPDRLLLVVPFADAERVGSIKLELNGAEHPIVSYDVTGGLAAPPRKIIYYADLTDAVKWGQPNSVTLNINGLLANQFLGPYLDYPAAPKTSAIAARPGAAVAAVIYDRPVRTPSPEPRPSDPVPAILSAWMDPPIAREGGKVTIYATTNLPAGEIQNVFLANIIGPDCWTDQELQYDAKTDRWWITLHYGERVRIILDTPYSYVWAVAKNGHVSPSRKIPMQWSFAKE